MTTERIEVFPDLEVARVQWRLERNTRQMVSPTTKKVQRTEPPGARWAADITMANMADRDLRVFERFMDRASRGDCTILTTPQFFVREGAFSADNVLVNPNFTANVNSWSASANAAITANARQLRLTNVSSDAVTWAEQAQNLNLNETYFARAACFPTNGIGRLVVERTSDDSDYINTAKTSSAVMLSGIFVPTTSSSTRVELQQTDGVAGDFIHWDAVSVARCARIDTASQTGSLLSIDGLPSSTQAVMKAAEFVELNEELYRLSHDVDSDGSGKAHIDIEPSVRTVPSSGDAVVYTDPRARMIWPDGQPAVTHVPGGVGQIRFTLVEDL